LAEPSHLSSDIFYSKNISPLAFTITEDAVNPSLEA
jgi:hypothetical protein